MTLSEISALARQDDVDLKQLLLNLRELAEPHPGRCFTEEELPLLMRRVRFDNLLYPNTEYSLLAAAMMLIPDDWYVFRLHQWLGDNFRWSVDLARRDMSLLKPVSVEDCLTAAHAVTSAVALVIGRGNNV